MKLPLTGRLGDGLIFNVPLAQTLADLPAGRQVEKPKPKVNTKSRYLFVC
jgi:hypothetical protein